MPIVKSKRDALEAKLVGKDYDANCLIFKSEIGGCEDIRYIHVEPVFMDAYDKGRVYSIYFNENVYISLDPIDEPVSKCSCCKRTPL